MSTLQPTISIALCTYNGKAHLAEQWKSLLEQKRLPTEIVISDDQSTDGTPELLKELAANAPFTVRILSNPNRLGSNKNFERALAACEGDLIFICDQDDFWLPNKIETMTQYMIQHAEAQITFCDAWVTDEQLQGKQHRVWEAVRFDTIIRDRWRAGEMMDIMLDGNRMMGCATVIRRTFLPTVLPIPENLPGDFIYDGWIALVGAAHNAVHFIEEPLQLYRTHRRQQVGIKQAPPPERLRLRDRIGRDRDLKLEPLVKIKNQIVQIGQLLTDRVPKDAPGWHQFEQRLAHFDMRSTLPESRIQRIVPVLSNLIQGNYHRYANPSANQFAPYLAVLGDLLE